MTKSFLLLLAAGLLVLCGCQAKTNTSGGEAVSEPSKLTAEEAYARMTSGDPVVVLDVRTAEEYAENHIPGAVLVPNEQIAATPPAELPVLSAEILIYCRSGNRSAQAAAKLAELGYTNVYDFGGIKDWPNDTESGEYVVPEKDGTLSSFAAYDLDGVSRDERIFADYSLTMINIWATFCGPCLREMPELGQLAADYASKGVQIVGIVSDVSMDADGSYSSKMVENARKLVAQTGADYLHLLPSTDLWSAKLNTVSAVPETIFVDSEGNLVGESYVGSRSGEAWAEIIDALLEQQTA